MSFFRGWAGELTMRFVDVAQAFPLFVLAIVQGRDWGWVSLEVMFSVFIGLACVSLFIYRNNGHQEPILPSGLVEVTSFRRASFALFIFAFGIYA